MTDYAVTLLSHMETKGDAVLWSAPDLADRSGLPMPTVSKILKTLAKGGLISAQRGASGGYRLSRAAARISVAQIIEAMDGPIAITECSGGNAHENCKIHSVCPLSDGWNKVNKAVKDALNSVSLSELFDGKVR